MKTKKRIVSFVLSFVLSMSMSMYIFALDVEDSSQDAARALAFATALIGTEMEISNVKYTGDLRAIGYFSDGDDAFGFSEGIVLSTGNAEGISGPNTMDDYSVEFNSEGDSDLNAMLNGNITVDAAVLEFDFVPTSNIVAFEYQFSSEEYNEYVATGFNDVFGFFVDGENIALIPNKDDEVSVNNVNADSNSEYYIDNTISAGSPKNTEMDGMTTVLTAEASVTPGAVHHIKLAIADASDPSYDSNVLIKAGSFDYTPGELSLYQLFVTPIFIDAEVGDSGEIRTDLMPIIGEDVNFSFISSNPNVVSVESDGTYTCDMPGECEIKVLTTYDGKIYSTGIPVEVNVVPGEAYLYVNPSSKSINIGDEMAVEAKLFTSTPAAVTYTFESENVNVVKVTTTTSSSAVVEGVGVGMTNIIVNAEDGGRSYTDNIVVTVLEVSTGDLGSGGGSVRTTRIIEDTLIPEATFVYQTAYITGFADGSFRPDTPVTRMEVAAMFARILNLDTTFTGVESGDVTDVLWGAGSIQACMELELFNGYNNGDFLPHNHITRAEVAQVICNYWDSEGAEYNVEGDVFGDTMGHWAEKKINGLNNRGLIKGYPDGTFKPEEAITRAEIVTVINNMIGLEEVNAAAPRFKDVPVEHWGFGDIEAAAME